MEEQIDELSILYKECESTGNKIMSLIVSSDRYLSMGFAVIVAAMAYGMKEDQKDILLILPYAILTVMFYSVHIITETMALGGYRCFLEEQINLKLGKNIVIWESGIARRRHTTDAPIFINVIYTVFLFLTIINSLVIAWKFYEKATFWLLLLGHLILLGGLTFEVLRLTKAFDNTYHLAKNAFEQKDT